MKLTRRQRLENFFGPACYGREFYIPTYLRIPLETIAKQMRWNMATLKVKWIDTGFLLVQSHYGSKPFSTKRNWERACVSSGLVPRPATTQIREDA